MSEKRPAETSTEEPVPKKQAITTEMYEELKEKIAELEKRNSELEKRHSEAQELTQSQIEKFQERTANAEEKMIMYKNTTFLSNYFLNSNISKDYVNYLNSDSKNRLSIIHHRFTFQISRYFIPGKPINDGLWLHNNQKIRSQYMIENGKCSICKNNKALYGYKDDNIKFPFKIGAVKIDKVLVPSGGLEEEIKFEGICNTLCKDCIIKLKLES